MADPAALAEAGLAIAREEDGVRLVVTDVAKDACAIRNRGGESLAKLLSDDRKVQALDIRESNLADVGVGQICLTLRQTDQLQELSVCPVGHHGLEFLLGVVRRCDQLRELRIEVQDVPTLYVAPSRIQAEDYDTSGHVAKKNEDADGEDEEGEEEEVEDEEEGAPTKEQKRADELRKIFAENDYDSEDEAHRAAAPAAGDQSSSTTAEKGLSPVLRRLLSTLVEEVRKKENLVVVQCAGDAVPADLQLDLERIAQEHRITQERRQCQKEERSERTALSALRGQMEELQADLDAVVKQTQSPDVAALLETEGAVGNEEWSTRLGMRAYINRRLFAVLGEALFECQRYKSKENEAVSTPQGEIAFISMYLRKHAKALQLEAKRQARR